MQSGLQDQKSVHLLHSAISLRQPLQDSKLTVDTVELQWFEQLKAF